MKTMKRNYVQFAMALLVGVLAVLSTLLVLSGEVSARPMRADGDLVINKVANADTVSVGADLVYTLTYQNTTTGILTNVRVTDTMDSNTVFVSAEPEASGTGTTRYWEIGSLGDSATGTIVLTVSVSSPLDNGTVLTNVAIVDSDQITPISDSVATTVAAPILNITKHADPDPVVGGASLTYTLHYSNTGDADAPGLIITDVLDSRVSFVSATPTAVQANNTLTWTPGTLAANTDAEIVVYVTVDGSLSEDITLSNQALLDSHLTDPTSVILNTDVLSHGVPSSVTLTPASTSVDAGQSVTYNLSATDAYNNTWDVTATAEYTITLSAGGSWTDNVYTAEKDGAWTVTGTYSGLSDDAALSVNNVAPTAHVDGPTSGDEGAQLSFDASASSDPGNDIIAYAWDFDYSGSFSVDDSGVLATHTYLDEGDYVLALRVTDDNSATDLFTMTINVANVAPSITSISSNSPVDEGSQTTISVTADDPGNDTLTFAYDWNDDGDYADPGEDSENHTWNDQGTHTVSVRVTDGDGGEDTDSTVVNVVNVPPDITDVTSDAPVDEGDPVTVSITANDPGDDILSYAYDWNDDGDFTDPGETSSTHTFYDDATYAVTIQVSDEDGGNSTDVINIVVDNVPPTITSVTNNSPVNEGDTAMINVSVSDPGNDSPIIGYNWNNDGDFDDEDETSNTHIYMNDGVYTVPIEVSDGDGGLDSATTVITVNNVAPTITDVTHSTPANEGTPVTVTVSASDPGSDDLGYGFDWNNDNDFNDPGEITNQASASASHVWPDDGLYTVRVVVYDDDTSVQTTHDISIQNVAPIVNAGNNQTVNEAEVVNFVGQFTDPGTDDTHNILWAFGDGTTTPNDLITTHVYSEPGNYNATLTVTDDDSGVGADALQVTVNNLPPTADAGGAYSGIAGTAVTLSAAGSADPGGGDLTYAWDLDNDGAYVDASGVTVLYTWTVAGVHTVRVQVSDTSSATDTDSAQVTIDPAPLDHIVLSPQTSTVFAWENQTYTVEAFDVYDNSRGNVTSQSAFDIVESGHLGSWTDNIYDPSYPGDWTVRAVYTDTQVASDTASLLVQSPVLNVDKKGDPDPVEAGAVLTYTLAVSNTGNLTATNVILTDTLDPNVTYSSADPAPSGGTSGSPFWSFDDLNPGDLEWITMVVSVTRPLPNNTLLTNMTEVVADHLSPISSSMDTTVHSRPVLTITKVDSSDPVDAGDTLQYTIVISNSGNENATNVTIFETYDPNTQYVFASPSPDTGSGNRLWTFPSLDVDTSEEIQLVVLVDSPLDFGTVLTNQVSLDSTQTAPITTSETTNATSASDLILSIVDVPDPVEAGADLSYIINYFNSGTATAEDVVITETYDSRVQFDSASRPPVPGTDNVWNLGDVPVNSGGYINVFAVVDSPLRNGTVLTNVVTIDSLDAPPRSLTETTNVTSAPFISFTVNDDPEPVAAGAELDYTILYTNTGNANATEVVITGALDANITYVDAQPTPAIGPGGILTWTFDTIAGKDNEGSYGTGEIIINSLVTSPLTNGTTLDFSTWLVDAEDDVLAAAEQTLVTSTPILPFDNQVNATDVVPGELITYTLSYANTGNEIAHQVIITDVLSPDVTFDEAWPAPDGWFDALTPYWIIGELAPSTSDQIVIQAVVKTPLVNQTAIVNTASIDCAQLPVASDVETSVVHSAPILVVSKVDEPDPVEAGELLTYTLSYRNDGDEIATNVVITDVLDEHLTFLDASPAPNGEIDQHTRIWTITNLTPTVSGQIVLTAQVERPLPNGTTLVNHAAVDCDQLPVSSLNESTVVHAMPILHLQKFESVDPVEAGDLLTYTIVYSNTGNETATGVLLTDILDANVTYQSATPTPNGGIAAGVPTWSIGDLVPDVTHVIMLQVRVNSPLTDGTMLTNRAILESDQVPALSRQTETTVSAAPDLSLTVEAIPDPVQAGEILTYTLTYANEGNEIALNAVLTDILDPNVTLLDASVTPTGGDAAGKPYWDLGDLVPAAPAEIVLRVSVTSPLTNNTVISNTGIFDCEQCVAVVISQQTTVRSAPQLSFEQDNGVTTAYAGDTLTYTLTFTNSGNANAYNLVITDALPNNVDYVSCQISEGDCELVLENTVVFTIPALLGEMGGEAQLVLQVHDTLPLQAFYLINSASMDAPILDEPITVDDVDTIGTLPDLVLTTNHHPSIFSPNKILTYTITYQNLGRMDAGDLLITTTLPTNTSYVGEGWMTENGQIYTYPITQLNALAGGQVVFAVLFDDLPQIGVADYQTPFSISESIRGDADPGNNTIAEHVGVPDLVILDFKVEPETRQPNTPVTFTVVLQNAGTGMAWNPDNEGGFTVDIYVNPVKSYPNEGYSELGIYAEVPTLTPGRVYTLTIERPGGFSQAELNMINGFYPKVDTHLLYRYGLVPEANEMNNVFIPDYTLYLPLALR